VSVPIVVAADLLLTDSNVRSNPLGDHDPPGQATSKRRQGVPSRRRSLSSAMLQPATLNAEADRRLPHHLRNHRPPVPPAPGALEPPFEVDFPRWLLRSTGSDVFVVYHRCLGVAEGNGLTRWRIDPLLLGPVGFLLGQPPAPPLPRLLLPSQQPTSGTARPAPAG
jgi:hypothetical protein